MADVSRSADAARPTPAAPGHSPPRQAPCLGTTNARREPSIACIAEFADKLVRANVCVQGRDMREQEVLFDYSRYQRLLVEAVDEKKRLALIKLLIEERAMDRLAAQQASDRAAMTAWTVSRVLGAQRR